MNDSIAIGIDLGTTNSAITVWQGGQARLIPNALGEVLTPSVVSIDEENQLLVGSPAASRLITYPTRTAAVFKRFIGSEKSYRLGDSSYSPVELCALVLGSLKQDAESALAQSIRDVVISVPAYFNDQQRKQVQVAAELAGLEAVRLINEPTAAAMAYSLHEREYGHYLVFDLGGGTFDVTLVEYVEGLVEVRASAGDNRLGGEDFTADLVDACLERFDLMRHDLPLTDLSRLHLACERAKCQRGAGGLEVMFSHNDSPSLHFSDQQLEAVWKSSLERLARPLRQVLSDARCQASDVDELIYVGGATRLSDVQQTATRLLGRFGRQTLNPEQVVAMGAAVQAACRLRDAVVEELILTDVCPFSLGIDAIRDGQSGVFSTIIERNTTVPCSRVERFWTASDQQDSVHIAIYQGERFWVKDNIRIDRFDVTVPKGPAGREGVDVRFSYDINGLLEVDVTIVSSGQRQQKVIDRAPVKISEQDKVESRARLARLKVHPRDMLPNIDLNERLNRLHEEKLGPAREELGRMIVYFQQALDSQDERRIRTARQELTAALEPFEY